MLLKVDEPDPGWGIGLKSTMRMGAMVLSWTYSTLNVCCIGLIKLHGRLRICSFGFCRRSVVAPIVPNGII